jgi:hypothetical protein
MQRLRASLAGGARSKNRLRPDHDRFATLRHQIGREIASDAPSTATESSPEAVPFRPVIAADNIAPSRFAPEIDDTPRGPAAPPRVDGNGVSHHPLSHLRRL